LVGGFGMRVKLLGCELFISPVFMGMLTILLLIDRTGLMGCVLGAMAIHELGHLLMMVIMGVPPREMRFLPFEINIVSDQSCASSWERFCIAVGGIIFNLLVFLVFIGETFGYINLYLALFNALPLYSMDGYQILTLLLGQKKKWVFVISAIITLVVLLFGCWLLIVEKNPMLILFSIYLLAVGVMEKRKGISG
jgi:stage IV sporulation protein FB